MVIPSHRIDREQTHLYAPPEERFQRAETMVHARRLQGLPETCEVALDAQDGEVMKVAHVERGTAFAKDDGIALNGPGGAVTDPPAQQKGL
jgi:hypothetical protein